MKGNIMLTEDTLQDLCSHGLNLLSQMRNIDEEVSRLQALMAKRNSLQMDYNAINKELQRRLCHDIGGALTLIATGEMTGDSTEIFDRNKNKVKKDQK